MEIHKVVFRRWRDSGDIIALFPEVPADLHGRYADSYEYVGQHGAADYLGVKATPHTFRHQCITWLTRHSGMADAELQLTTGHSRHVALDSELERKYQGAMREVEL